MKRFILSLCITLVSNAAALPTVFLTLRTVTPVTSDVPPSFTLILQNFGPGPRTVNFAPCPQFTVTSLSSRKLVPLPGTACPVSPRGAEPVTVAPDTWQSFPATLPARLPSGEYEVTATFAGVSAKTFLRVEEPPKLVQTLMAPGMVQADGPVTFTVTWHNPSARMVGQDLRLCGLHYMVVGKGGERVADNLNEMLVCLTDLRLTDIPPGDARQVQWTLLVKLPPGSYTVFLAGPVNGSVSFRVMDPRAPL